MAMTLYERMNGRMAKGIEVRRDSDPAATASMILFLSASYRVTLWKSLYSLAYRPDHGRSQDSLEDADDKIGDVEPERTSNVGAKRRESGCHIDTIVCEATERESDSVMLVLRKLG